MTGALIADDLQRNVSLPAIDQVLIEGEDVDRVAQEAAGTSADASAPSGDAKAPALGGAERRALEKEAASLDRRLEKATMQRAAVMARFELVDHSDFDALAALQAELADADARIAELEEAWLEAHEGLEA